MLSIEEVAQEPIKVEVRRADGSAVAFALPRLRMRDYVAWVGEETERRRAAARKAIPKGLQPIDLYRAQRSVENEQATLNDVWRAVQTPEGAIRVVETSLSLANLMGDDDKRFLRHVLPPWAVSQLAQDLSGLFAPPEPLPMPADAARPGAAGGPFAAAASPPAAPPADSTAAASADADADGPDRTPPAEADAIGSAT
jgi:hypothetical protein